MKYTTAEKVRTRSLTQIAIRAGQIKPKKNCEDCGATARHCHHLDYSDPFAVAWLCVSCHRQRHAQLRQQYREALWTDDFITSLKIAQVLLFAESTVQRWMANKEIPGERRGSEWRMDKNDFAELTKPMLPDTV